MNKPDDNSTNAGSKPQTGAPPENTYGRSLLRAGKRIALGIVFLIGIWVTFVYHIQPGCSTELVCAIAERARGKADGPVSTCPRNSSWPFFYRNVKDEVEAYIHKHGKDGISMLFEVMMQEGAVLHVGRLEIMEISPDEQRRNVLSRTFMFERSIRRGWIWGKVLIIAFIISDGDLVLQCAIVETRTP